MDRVQPKQNFNPEQPLLSTFMGLSSNTNIASSDVTYADLANNVYINSEAKVKQREGSKVIANYNDVSVTQVNNPFKYRFADRDYILSKIGDDAYLDLLDSDGEQEITLTKTGAYGTFATNNSATFTQIIDDDVNWIISGVQENRLRAFAQIKRECYVTNVIDMDNVEITMQRYPSPDSITTANTILFDTSGNRIVTNSLSQVFFTITANIPSHGYINHDRVIAVMFYACSCEYANYYPGSYLYNSSIRRNIADVDVNVPVASDILDTPILNEALPDLTANVIKAYQDPLTPYTLAALPTTAYEYAMTDGSFTPGAGSLTPSPEFFSFGGLHGGGGVPTYVNQYRLRNVPESKGLNISSTFVAVYVNKLSSSSLYGVTFYDETGAVTTTACRYIQVNCGLSDVVECFYFSSLTVPTTVNIVDLSDDNAIFIGDGFFIPLYGYDNISSSQGASFPTIAQAVGNRLILTGRNNKVAVSNADWKYRGISWNNFQVSSINFSSNSAYIVTLLQGVSKVSAVNSVNGVVIVGTDVGVFRISGENNITPPNATTARVSKIADGLVDNQQCLLVWEGRVFVANEFGLYKLEYAQQSEDIVVQSISINVQDFFVKRVNALMYSPYYRSLMMSFYDSDGLLVYNLYSDTFTQFLPSFSDSLNVTQGIDGYLITSDQDNTYKGNALKCFLVCNWTSDSTDLSNVSGITAPNLTLTNRSVAVSGVTDASSLCSAVEKFSSLEQCYGKNTLKGTGTAEDTTTTGVTPYPIISFYRTKAFISDRLFNSNRLRFFLTLISGIGSGTFWLYGRDRESRQTTYTIGSDGTKTIDDQLYEQVVSDMDFVKLRSEGVGEYFYMVCQLSGIELVGFQLDLSSQGSRQLRDAV